MFTSPVPLAHLSLTSMIILDPLVVEPETMVMEAIAQMDGKRSHYVLVVESEHLLGIFTAQDVVSLMIQQQSLHNLVMREVMTFPVITLQESAFTDALVAINLLQKCHISQLPIVDESDRLVGLVTYDSLHQTLNICPQENITDLEKNYTVRKVAEAALQSSETRFRRVFESNIVGMMFTDFNGQITDANDRFLELLGYSREDLIAKRINWETITPAEYLPSDLHALQHLKLSRVIAPWEKVYYHKDGHLVHVLIGIAMLSEDDCVCVVVDISDRKQAEEMIRQQVDQSKLLQTITQRMRSTLNLDEILKTTVDEIHQVLNSDRALVYRVFPDGTGAVIAESVSFQWQSILDITFPEEIFPQVNYDRYLKGRIFALRDREAEPLEVLPCLAEFLAEIQVRAKLVVPIIQNDTLWGLLIAHQCDRPRHWQTWEINLLQQIANQLAIAIQQADLFVQLQQELRDRQQTQKHLTEINQRLAESNEELARATRLKDEFLANMSHELRTPLNAILGMTEGMQEQVFGKISNAQIKALQTIERSGSHLLELINDILDVAKIESGQIELEYSTISVELLCQSSLTFIKQQALKKSIQLETKLAPNLPELIVDERRIRQVLINLLNNAVKFTPDGGHITLAVSCHPLSAQEAIASTSELAVSSYLHIAISDTGIGIAPENISKLFQPFIQIDSALNRQYQGTGLGLALVKRIVEMHGGKVMLSSEVGVGSCFTVILPCTEPASASVFVTMENQTELSIESGQSQQTAPVILLVEDNEANIISVSSYLTAKGYLIVLANNGKEAIALAGSAKPDLILMDIQMPVMDGLEAMQKIRQIPNLVNVPIIALTALAMENDIKRCIDAGANDYLSKPVKLRQLTKTIQQFLDPKRLEVK
jgi:PAS domain S-box-containing protein